MSQTKAQLISSLVQPLTGADGTQGAPTFSFTDDADTGLFRPGDNTLGLATGGSTRLTIDSSGRLLVGTTTGDGNSTAHFQGNAGASIGGAFISLQRGQANPTSGTELATIAFTDNARSQGARIQAFTDGDWAASDFPTRLLFLTTADGESSPTERMRISANGNITVDTDTFFVDAVNNRVGIGTPSPAAPLSVVGGTGADPTIYLIGASNDNARIGSRFNLVLACNEDGNQSNRTITFNNHTSEFARIDSSGRLLVGTSTARANFFNSASGQETTVQIEGTTGGTSSFSLTRNTNGEDPPHLIFGKTRGTSVGSNTVVQSGDRIALLDFQGADGSELVRAASIEAFVDGTPGANDMPGRLSFLTTADGAAVPTERMRITNDGQIVLGTGTPLTGGTLTVVPNATGNFNTARMTWNRSPSTDGCTAAAFLNGGSVSGSITYGQSSTAYNTSSDYRLKENVVDLDGAIVRIKQLAPKRFNFIVNAEKTVDGFLAHEAQTVVPEAVTGTKDEVDENGDPVMQGIDQSKLVPLLTAALQEAITKIETLEAKVAALEAN